MGLKKNNPGCDCCGETCPPCVDNQADQVIAVTITGIVNDSCEDCDEFNAAYGASFLPDMTTENNCYWEYRVTDCPCLDDPDEEVIVFVAINFLESEGFIRVTQGGYIDGYLQWEVTWYKALDTRPDCVNLSDVDIPYLSQDGSYPCDASGSTCTIN